MREHLTECFDALLRSVGSAFVEPVKIISGFDPTVRFIGSHISLFKTRLRLRDVPSAGLHTCQPCIRTHNAAGLFDDAPLPTWTSYFENLGFVSQSVDPNPGCRILIEFFQACVGLQLDELRIDVCDTDDDLKEAAIAALGEQRVDSGPCEPRHRHEFGETGWSGRNFNLLQRHRGDGTFARVANIVVMDDRGTAFATELSVGLPVVLRQLSGCRQMQDLSPFHGCFVGEPNSVGRLEDALHVSLVLFREGLRPSSDNQGRILKRYLRAALFHKLRLGIDDEGFVESFRLGAIREPYLAGLDVATDVTTTIGRYEAAIRSGRIRAKDEQRIHAVLVDEGS
jgi:hypothetical protein